MACKQDRIKLAQTWEKSAESFKQQVIATSISTTSNGGCVPARLLIFRMQKLMQLFLWMNMITSSKEEGGSLDKGNV